MKQIWNAPVVRFGRDVATLYFSKRVSRSAAELAYFFVLTFFPILICIHAFVGLLPLNTATVLLWASAFVPQESLGILGDYITYIGENQSTAMLVAGIVTTLFPASAALRALMNIMDDIYGRRTYRGLGQIVASVLFSVLLLITLYLSLVVVLTGNWFFTAFESLFHITFPPNSWAWMRFFLLFSLVLFFILMVYRMAAPRGTPHPPVLPGAILAAVVLVAASGLFSWFIGLSSRYSMIYGSLASMIILLVWLYLCGNILILGNVCNAVWYAHRRNNTL